MASNTSTTLSGTIPLSARLGTLTSQFQDWELHTTQAVQISVSFFITVVIPALVFLYSRYLKPGKPFDKVPTYQVEPPVEALPHWKGKRLDPITLRSPEDPAKIQCYCPATGQYLGAVRASNREDIDLAVRQAGKAQKEWAATSFAQRKQVLRALQRFILRNQDMIARVACRDSGKTMVDASMGEILVTLEKIGWILRNGEKTLKPSTRPGPANILLRYKKAEVRYEPMGVVAALVSWNYPFHNLMGPVIASIFTGNGIVVKCSENVVWSSLYFLQIARGALTACGHDPNLIQLVTCWPEDADYLTAHRDVSHITFIGSQAVAHKVTAAASRALTPVVVELGGKDAFIVLDDAPDLESISSIVMRGSFQSSGQNCIGIERVIALPKAYDTLVEILSRRVPSLRLGSGIDQQDAVDMGACITDARFEALESLITEAVNSGARLIHGGKRYTHPKYPQGHYFLPTLIVDVTKDMRLAQEEVFGPILTVMRAESVDEAIDIANSTDYGLGGSVFGSNWKDLNRVAGEMRTGNVSINDFATYYLCQLPFGGVRGSGYGKFGGEEGLTGLCFAKSVCYDKLPFISTKIPRPIDYPIVDMKRAWMFVKSLCVSGYDSSIWNRVKAIVKLAKNA